MCYNSYILRNIKRYPKIQKQDIFKLLYQDNLLVGHLVENSQVKEYLEKEIKDLNLDSNELIYEFISEDVVRINCLPFLKVYNLDCLIKLFVQTSLLKTKNNLYQDALKYDLLDYYQKYQDKIPSHSEIYRKNYQPHYRVVATPLLNQELRALKLQNFIESIRNEKLQIIALEGRCGSGKSTISKLLKDVTVIEMDDHFDSKDNPVNVEYIDRLLSSLELGKTISEKCYDCSSNSYYEKQKEVKNIVVVEGVYGYLPQLRKHFDFLAYVVLDKKLQIERIKSRKNFNQFIEKWIPREEEYFSKFDFVLNADVLI